MASGLISLSRIYEFVSDHRNGEALRATSAQGRDYARIAQQVAAPLPTASGFYLWGTYEPNGLWRNIYLGQATLGKTAHLHARVLEELKDERWCFWRHVMSKKDLHQLREEYYGRYKHEVERAIAKAESSHIAWVSVAGLDQVEMRTLEADLIETLNPVANAMRPAPPSKLQARTHEVIAAFRAEIHAHRLPPYLQFRRWAAVSAGDSGEVATMDPKTTITELPEIS